MGWTKSGSIKGPKGDDGGASGGIPQGAIVLAYNGSPAWKALKESDEWIDLGSFLHSIDHPAYDVHGNPTPNDTSTESRRLVLFAKA